MQLLETLSENPPRWNESPKQINQPTKPKRIPKTQSPLKLQLKPKPKNNTPKNPKQIKKKPTNLPHVKRQLLLTQKQRQVTTKSSATCVITAELENNLNAPVCVRSVVQAGSFRPAGHEVFGGWLPLVLSGSGISLQVLYDYPAPVEASSDHSWFLPHTMNPSWYQGWKRGLSWCFASLSI